MDKMLSNDLIKLSFSLILTNYNKCITVVGGVENRGAMQELGHSVYEKYLYLPLSIAVNVKLFNKSKIFFKKSKNLKKMKGYVTFTFDTFL